MKDLGSTCEELTLSKTGPLYPKADIGADVAGGRGPGGELNTTSNGNHERGLTAGRWRSPPPSLSLLLDAFDPDCAEASVFVANVCLKLLLFDSECFEGVHIGKL